MGIAYGWGGGEAKACECVLLVWVGWGGVGRRRLASVCVAGHLAT